MRFSPEKNGKNASAAVIALFLCAAVAFGASLLGIPPESILQLTGVIFAAAAIWVTVRKSLVSYTYIIRPKSGIHDDDNGNEAYDTMPLRSIPKSSLELVIEEAQGRKIGIARVRISLADIEECVNLPDNLSERRRVYRDHHDVRRVDCIGELFPRGIQLVVFHAGDGAKFGLLVRMSDEMREIIG